MQLDGCMFAKPGGLSHATVTYFGASPTCKTSAVAAQTGPCYGVLLTSEPRRRHALWSASCAHLSG
eukprot:396030-Amphidinium_carterae.2